MTTPQEQLVELARRSQEAAASALHTWTENIQKLAGGLAGGQSNLPTLSEIVDRVFDFAEQMLANQRELAKRLLAATGQATESSAEQVPSAASNAGGAAKD